MSTSAAVSPHVADCYERYSRELWASFYGMCSDPERAWEAVQEAFLRFQSQSGDAVRDERAWLLHVGRNWLRDFARRRRNAEVAVQDMTAVIAGTLDPPGVAALGELREQVGRALSQLRIDDREVLLLRYALGWSSPRIGEVLGLRVAAVDMRLTRARQRLAVVLDEIGVDAESMN
jgi:RNA polymerase sigma factor (sigma-70 family)